LGRIVIARRGNFGRKPRVFEHPEHEKARGVKLDGLSLL
jgi:hypothetical protein